MQPQSRGSWPVLAVLLGLFFGTFWLLRQRSAFLAIEQDHPAAVAVARQHGLSVAEAMALREQVGPAASAGQWAQAVVVYVAQRARLGEPLAAVAAAGQLAAAEAALLRAGDAERAWAEFRGQPGALPGLRFLALRERFAQRMPLRN